MATSTVFEIGINDFRQKFQSAAELSQYVKDRIIPKLQDAATDVFAASGLRTRALDQSLTGEWAGFWKEDQPYNSRSVEVGISARISF